MQYVRREIRQLQDADRETFFDTMETLYRLSTAEGVHLYGDEYKVSSSTWLTVRARFLELGVYGLVLGLYGVRVWLSCRRRIENRFFETMQNLYLRGRLQNEYTNATTSTSKGSCNTVTRSDALSLPQPLELLLFVQPLSFVLLFLLSEVPTELRKTSPFSKGTHRFRPFYS